MKVFRSLFEISKAFKRKSKQVVAVLSFNGNAYFLFRSNPTPEAAVMIQAFRTMLVGNELSGNKENNIDNERKNQLFKFLMDSGLSKEFPQKSQHAEEHLIQGFPEALEAFKALYPDQKIKTIDVFLSHSPCSKGGIRKFSSASTINQFFLPAGCNKKLEVFFKNKNYLKHAKHLFEEDPKVRVRYNIVFEPSLPNNDGDFLKEADPGLKSFLGTAL